MACGWRRVGRWLRTMRDREARTPSLATLPVGPSAAAVTHAVLYASIQADHLRKAPVLSVRVSGPSWFCTSRRPGLLRAPRERPQPAGGTSTGVAPDLGGRSQPLAPAPANGRASRPPLGRPRAPLHQTSAGRPATGPAWWRPPRRGATSHREVFWGVRSLRGHRTSRHPRHRGSRRDHRGRVERPPCGRPRPVPADVRPARLSRILARPATAADRTSGSTSSPSLPASSSRSAAAPWPQRSIEPSHRAAGPERPGPPRRRGGLRRRRRPWKGALIRPRTPRSTPRASAGLGWGGSRAGPARGGRRGRSAASPTPTWPGRGPPRWPRPQPRGADPR